MALETRCKVSGRVLCKLFFFVCVFVLFFYLCTIRFDPESRPPPTSPRPTAPSPPLSLFVVYTVLIKSIDL